MIKFKFKYDYCKKSFKRVKFTTTLDHRLVEELKNLSDATGEPISKAIECVFANVFSSQESVDEFLKDLKRYDGLG